MSDLVAGPLVGRFLRLEKSVETHQSLLERALPHAWTIPSSWGRLARGWCCEKLPHSGELREGGGALAYDDDGSGTWLCWLREEERSASRRAVQTLAASICVKEYNTHFDEMNRDEQEEMKGVAMERLLQRAVPKMRVLQFVLTEGWIWVGRRALEDAYRNKLFPLVGATHYDVVAWNPDTHGWYSLSLAALQAYLDSSDGFLDVDVELVEIRLKGDQISCQTEGANEEVRKAIGRLFEVSSAGITQLSFHVHMHGEIVRVDLDQHGLFRGMPPRSSGGMLHERLGRRFGELREAAERVGEVMVAVFEARS